ncbi:hypothetical protein DPQ33_04895 [Oceanidesulfovibrio indonesiensis]|uniref:Uncharacterized protein n=1 Tax=Oceanidesulfovibrio indonesiensis TaxID=54767 RepID=A0A7M3MH46_9BACT|nr:hypothetical protein [Oceanidesulfovibrio indonesiensis]TVM18809.1 hypothetical protein DPQ33_04895 [Oceanidesulfovibrio indonesiensis]
MQPIIIRFVLNKPSNRVALQKLHSSIGAVGSYLNSLARDMDFENQEEWQVANVTQRNKNDAIAFNIISNKKYKDVIVEEFTEQIYLFEDFERLRKSTRISEQTIDSFVKLANVLEEGDKIKLGSKFFKDKKGKWSIITKEKGHRIKESWSKSYELYGDVQGVIKSFSKGKVVHHCKIQDLIFDSIVDCSFADDLYDAVAKLFVGRDTIVQAFGRAKADTTTNRITKMDIDKMYESPAFESGDIGKFRGCAPQLKAELKSSEWLHNE